MTLPLHHATLYSAPWYAPFIVASAAALAVAACGGGGGDATATGTMRLSLTDAPACGMDNVWVTVQKVRVHKSGAAGDNDAGWQEIALAAPPPRIDLLQYTNGETLPLGATTLPAGSYNQMRLVLAPNTGAAPWPNAIKPTGGVETALDTPSGQQSGLKFNVQMDVAAGQVADFVIDFEACRSVVKAGHSGRYLLKPVVRVIPVLSPAGQSIVGSVEPSLARGDTLVSVQDNDGNVVKSTPPLGDGRFVLSPVPAGTYNLVITAAGRVNAVMTGVPVTGGAAPTTVNAASAPLSTPATPASYAAKGTLSGASGDTVGTVRALQAVANGPTLQAGAANAIANGGSYSITLPNGAPAMTAFSASAASYSFASAASGAGAYRLSATVEGVATPKTADIAITSADVTTNFVFP